MNKKKIRIDVVSDVVCPWCYIGKRRMEKAVNELKDSYDIQIQYLPFELNPSIPKEGYNLKEYYIQKFGGYDRYKKLTEHVSQIAAEEGLTFRFDKQMTSPNTLDAHRIIWLAGKEGKQIAVVEALFKAYFESGIDLTQPSNLTSVAVEAGLDEKKVEELLAGDAAKEDIKKQQLFNQQAGVTGVPFYIINSTYGISGAQPSDVFVKVLQDIAAENSTSGPSCDVDGNC